jgi:hypothetical protein
MRTCFRDALMVVAAAGTLAACHTASRQAATPTPESEQVIGSASKDLYMKASMAPPHSAEQQKLILKMAQEASNGKELLLVMRAADGVFPSAAAPGQQSVESQVRSTVTAKMIELATLDQLTDYAVEYPVDQEHTRRCVERMFELGGNASDARAWYRIKAAAFHLGLSDLERQAQAKGDQLASR